MTGRAPSRRRASTPRTRTAKTVKPVPTAGAGERIWILEVPFRVQLPGVSYVPAWKAHAYVGAELPAALAPYASLPYSYQRFVEDELNGEVGPGAQAHPRLPRPEQCDGAEAIVAAARAGARGFYLADDPGTGKTITAVMAVREIAELRGETSVLVTVDRPTSITIAHWRASIAAVGDGGLRWLLLSPDQLRKLLARNGKPRYRFGICVLDEAHLYRHTDTQRTTAMRRVARYTDAHDTAPFVLALTATPGHHPGEMTYLSPLFAQVHDEPPARWSPLGARMAAAGIPLERSGTRWTWTAQAKESGAVQQAATETVRGWLTEADPPVMLHRSAPWGPAPLDGLPVDLSADERSAYESEWGEYCREMGLARRGRDVARGRAAVLRFRQKAGMLRAPASAEWVHAQVERGYQVAVSVNFVGTAAEPLAELLTDRGLQVARIFGPDADREHERMLFQRGAADVVVFNTSSSISLHANELLADGTRASATPRVGLIHQPSYSGIEARQTLGRTHRDHQVCPWYLGYGVSTVEEQVAAVMLDRLRQSSDSVGADTTALHSIAELLGADWLPDDALS
ncbi:DEAD/DEAH box helicase [Rhodococcus sp. X156]|uniref:DEAD/DEAH box helicase n=1 Tax=Rhodococcus sp. X156 TaxID=2499145 RepID=UPI000FD7A912|nr:DEAD/DEAH box helicase [Rhodococcus sp. X156]